MNNLYLKKILPAALALTLTACSGSGGGDVSGSSIMSGTVTRFGSLFVNGVKLNTDSASFNIDGAPGTQDDLEVGMVVRVTGTVNADGVSGTASTITFDDQLQGPVSGLTAATFGGTRRAFTVLGTTVSINDMDTVFAISGEEAIPAGTSFNFETIAQGNNVEISGFFDASGILHATRVELKNLTFDSASIVEVKGTVAGLTNNSFTLGGLTVNADTALMDGLPGGLQTGVQVEVKGSFDSTTNILTATRVDSANEDIGDADHVSIEGLVRDFVDNSDFRLNGNAVDASAALLIPTTLILSNDIRIEAEGPVVGGVLQAETIELRGGEDRIHARISSIDVGNSRFDVMPVTGQPAITVMINNATEMRDDVDKMRPFGIDDLVIGDFAVVRGFVSAAVVSANRVRIRKNGDVIVQGIRQSGAANDVIKLLGVEFAIDAPGVTDFRDPNDIGITQAQFDQAASANDTTLIKIKDREVAADTGVGNGIADEVEIQAPFGGSSAVLGKPPLSDVIAGVIVAPVINPAATAVGLLDISGTASPGDTVIVVNANGALLGTAFADLSGSWRINKPLNATVMPINGDLLTVTSSSSGGATFSFSDVATNTNIAGSGALVITSMSTRLEISVRPAPVMQVGVANIVGELQHLGGLTTEFYNLSRPGRPRLDIIIADVPRTLIVNTGDAFGDTGTGSGVQLDLIGSANPPGTIGVGDMLTLDRLSAVFKDGAGNVIRSFAEDNVVVEAQEMIAADGFTITGARQDVVEILWSIRLDGVTTLAGATRVEILLDGGTAAQSVLATADIAGDMTLNSALGVTFSNIVNGLPAVAAIPKPAGFTGEPVAPLVGGAGPQGQSGYLVSGDISEIRLVDATDRFSAGTISLTGGETVVIPRNLILTLPANWLTLQEFAEQAPDAEKINGIGVGHMAIIMGNRQSNGIVIAGDVSIHKNDQNRQGLVTFINAAEGYFRINGNGNDTGGTMVRPNDPEGVHSVQSGRGVADSTVANGSPDLRYTNDPTNYTIAATTGYPMGINGINLGPNSGRTGGDSGGVVDATRFEPLLIGDFVTATGSIETVNGVTFQSAHTIGVGVAITTAPGVPDYIVVDEAEWDTAGWANRRLKGLNIGMMSSNADANIYRLAHNGSSDATGVDGDSNLAQFIGGTAAAEALGGNPKTNTAATVVNGLLTPGKGQVIKLVYDWDFLSGESKPERNPAAVVAIAGDPGGLLGKFAGDANNAFSVFAPIAREIVYKTSTWEAAVAAFAAGTGPDPSTMVTDVRGNSAQWGFYISPNGIGHPEWGEINLAAFNTPFIFRAQLWNLDRRLGPVGGDESTAVIPLGDLALNPFPSSGLAVDAHVGNGVLVPDNISAEVTRDPVTGTVLTLDPQASFDAAAGAAEVMARAVPVVLQ